MKDTNEQTPTTRQLFFKENPTKKKKDMKYNNKFSAFIIILNIPLSLTHNPSIDLMQ